VPDWTSWYSSAILGPHAPCFPATAVDPPVFDDDGVLELATNGSAGTLDLTPTTSYTWQTVYGELSWNAATCELTVKGVIYFDGSAVVSNGAVDEYNGGGDCDFDAGTDWNPNTEMLIVAAHGKHASGDSVALENNTRWEGGIYAQDNLALVNDAKVEGPDDPRRLHGHEQRLRGAVPGDRHGAARRPGEPERLRRRADARDIG
jgi:hypothetical protein